MRSLPLLHTGHPHLAMRTAFSTATPCKVLHTAGLRVSCVRRPSVSLSMKRSTEGLVLVSDVLDTLVYDPFSRGMAAHFGYSTMGEFLAAKTPETWVRFESGQLTEAELSAQFFRDRPPIDVAALKTFLSQRYSLIPGAADLLRDFANANIPVHLCTNYPAWTSLIEDAVHLESFGAKWTFISADHGTRKPQHDAYVITARLAAVPPAQCVLLDDRQSNCDGAISAGFHAAFRFHDVEQARVQLAPLFGDWLLEK